MVVIAVIILLAAAVFVFRAPIQQAMSRDKEVENDTLVYWTLSWPLYHRSSCSIVRDGFEAGTVEEARKHNLKPCTVCNPPE